MEYCFNSKYYENGILLEENNEDKMSRFDQLKPLVILSEKVLYSGSENDLYFDSLREDFWFSLKGRINFNNQSIL